MPKVSVSHRTRRRHQILEAAFQCFARSGFHSTSMQDVCREAKLSPGAVYLYFAGKESILEALAEAFRNQTAEWLGQCKGKSLAEVIDQVLQQLNRAEDLAGFQLDVRLWGEAIHTPVLAAILRQSQETLFNGLSEIVMNAPQKRTRRQAQAIARLLVAVISGFELQRATNPEVELGPAAAFLKAALQADLNPAILPDVRRALRKGGRS
jgi:AcrR family transcriptional regulator